MKDVRIIKRYQNRKLYDTFQSCYVTLEEISQIIREGNEIQVIDNKTKDDITYRTQLQLLADQEKKSLKAPNTELLKRVICSNDGTFTGYIQSLEAQLNISNVENNEVNAVNTDVNTNIEIPSSSLFTTSNNTDSMSGEINNTLN